MSFNPFRSSRFSGLNSIQGRLTAIALLFIAGTALSVAVVGFRFTVNFENERYRDHFSLLASYLASNAELGVLLGNQTILQRLSENMLTIDDVQLVEIFDNQQKIIVRVVRSDSLPELGYVRANVISTTIGTDSFIFATPDTPQALGKVHIGYSFSGLEQLKKQLALGFGVLSLLLALIPLFLYWRLSRAIRAPLKHVLHVAAEVSRGRMDIRAEGGTLIETITLANAFNEMLEALQLQRQQLKQANEDVVRQCSLAEVGKFSMTVAHEIKNPLAIIKGSLAVLTKQPPPDAALTQKMFTFIDEEILRINTLIEDFLLFARPSKAVLLTQRVDNLLDNLSHRIQLIDKTIQVSRPVAGEFSSRKIKCDIALVERALHNLVRNALEATEFSGGVYVTFECIPSKLILTVKDNGPGIKQEHLEQIFDPFISHKAKGTGLGLAIAMEAVIAHDGTLTVDNLDTGGACFVISLPFDGQIELTAENN
ncbi:MAG: hypothetical protein JRG71_11470 [Deltaproteobacteria bacterium]|nr:hypothetical protein [Deltaproteobacteria bacterium]